MEITFEQKHSYSLTLKPADRRELADHLDITERELRRLVEKGDLMDEHDAAVTDWVSRRSDDAEVTAHEDIEVDQITW